MSKKITFALRSTSSAALRTPSQACLSHGFLALVETKMMTLGFMMMIMMVLTVAYQRSLW